MDRILVVTWVVLLAVFAVARAGDWRGPTPAYAKSDAPTLAQR